MIIYRCDCCRKDEEHDGPDLPPGWASVVAMVRWQKADSGMDQECNARLLCRGCRGLDQGLLCLSVERILSNGFCNVKAAPVESGAEHGN